MNRFYVVAHDTILSSLGLSGVKQSYVSIQCQTHTQAVAVRNMLEDMGSFAKVTIQSQPKKATKKTHVSTQTYADFVRA